MRMLLTYILLFIAPFAQSAPVAYEVDKAKTDIGFFYTFGDQKIRGTFPDFKIAVSIDFANHENTTLSASLATQTAKGGFAFGTQAMRGPKILNAKSFPDLNFKTNSVSGKGATATITGIATIKGISKPITLAAKLFRAKGSDPSDLSELVLKVSSDINRFDFGADGYKNEVGRILNLDFKVVLKRQ